MITFRKTTLTTVMVAAIAGAVVFFYSGVSSPSPDAKASTVAQANISYAQCPPNWSTNLVTAMRH